MVAEAQSNEMTLVWALIAAALLPFAGSLTLAPAARHGAAALASSRNPQRAAVHLAEDVPDPDAVIKDASAKFKKTLASTQEQLSTLRVGRASPSLLDRVEVEYYGAPTPLNQLASVSAPTASQLVVDPFDKSALGDVEKALFESDLGMTPNNDGKVIRLNVPALTEDRRKELAKTAKSLGEDGKVAIRNIRKTALDKIKKMKKEIGEDVVKDKEDAVQKSVKKYEDEIESAVSAREKEIMTV